MNKKRISDFQGNQLLVDGAPFYLRGAEIHYFRLPISEWRHRLETALKGGMNTVSTYMPWYWHESEEGKFDLEGKTLPEKNLRHFLELAAELDMKVIARPGPFVNSELRWGGMPKWLFSDHPETMTRRGDGKIGTGRPCPAEGEPVYRKYVHKWYSQIVPLIAEFDIHRKGTVILFQPDNELSSAWSYGLLNSLYDPTILKQKWPEWLKGNYKDIKILNGKYSKNYGSFKEVEAPTEFPKNNPDKQRCFDWLNFKRHFFAEWGALMAKWAIDFGVKVPMIFNEPVAGFYGHGDHSGFGATLKQLGFKGTTACHTYADRIMDLEGIQGASMGIEMVKSSPWGGPPMAVEVNNSWYFPRLCRSEVNWDVLLRIGLARGLSGHVVYPYASCLVPNEDTIKSPDYWRPSCVDIDRQLTPAFHYLKNFNSFISSWEKELCKAETVSDITIAFSPGMRLIDFLGAQPLVENKVETTDSEAAPGGDSFDTEPVLNKSKNVSGHDWLDGYEGVSKQTETPSSGIWRKVKETALLCDRMNLSYDMLDLTNPKNAPGGKWIIVINNGTLEAKAIDYLLKHLDNDGGILFSPTIPLFNEDGGKDERLLKRLGIKLEELVRPAGAEILDYGCRIVQYGKDKPLGVDSWIYQHSFPRGSEILASFNGNPVAGKLKKGNRVVVSGIEPFFTTLTSLDYWQTIFMDAMGISPTLLCEGNFCRCTLRKSGDMGFLTVMNVTGISGKSRISLDGITGKSEILKLDMELLPHEARCMVINAKIAGRQMEYTTSEICRTKEKGGMIFELRGRSGTPGEIVFTELTTVKLDGKLVKTVKKNGKNVISYTHAEIPLKLIIVSK